MRSLTTRAVVLTLILVLGIAITADAAERRTRTRKADRRGPVQGAALAEIFTYQSGWAREIDHQAGSTIDIGRVGEQSRPGGMYGFEREVLVEGIAHYTADVQVGDGPYDVIRIHRVVKELEPYRPIRTGKNIFLLHGSAVGFVKFIFGSASPSTPDDRSVAVYLAQNGIDVWGMDQDWALVPAETTDFGFMADWGLQRQIDNLDTAVEVARYTRLHTGNGFTRMNVLGYSSGAMTIYALANQETQLPPGLRNVGGIVPVDISYKIGPEYPSSQEFACVHAANVNATWESGTYNSTTGVLFLTLGGLAQLAPDETSPVFGWLTNYQAALFAVSQTWALFPSTEWFHYMGGIFDEAGLPVDLTFTTDDAAFEFMSSASPYEAMAFVRDYAAVRCGEEELPFDDYLDEITVPVLYVGPVGGFGETGIYSTTLLGSSDVTLLLPQFLTDDERHLDIGHIDIWTAEVAAEAVWQPLLDWVVEHSVGRP